MMHYYTIGETRKDNEYAAAIIRSGESRKRGWSP